MKVSSKKFLKLKNDNPAEAILENDLVKQLAGQGYAKVRIVGEAELLNNLQEQLEAFNNTQFSGCEFEGVFRDKNQLIKRVDQLIPFRNKFAHNNDATIVELDDAKASLDWFNLILK